MRKGVIGVARYGSQPYIRYRPRLNGTDCTRAIRVTSLTHGGILLNGAVAQLVEHRTENPSVASSILARTTPPIGHSND